MAAQFELDLGTMPSPLLREARRLAAPLLADVATGALTLPKWDAKGMFATHTPETRAFVDRLAEVTRGEKKRPGIEKNGIVLCETIVYKVGKRAEVEPKIWARSNAKVRDLLVPCELLLPGVAVAYRVRPLDDFDPSALCTILDAPGYDARMRKLRRISRDDHNGNIGVDSRGKLVWLDYSLHKDG